MACPLSECNAVRALDGWVFAHPASVEREPKQRLSTSLLGDCHGCRQCLGTVGRVDGDACLLETPPRHVVAGGSRAAIGPPIELMHDPHAARIWTGNLGPRQALDQPRRA